MADVFVPGLWPYSCIITWTLTPTPWKLNAPIISWLLCKLHTFSLNFINHFLCFINKPFYPSNQPTNQIPNYIQIKVCQEQVIQNVILWVFPHHHEQEPAASDLVQPPSAWGAPAAMFAQTEPPCSYGLPGACATVTNFLGHLFKRNADLVSFSWSAVV